VVSLGAAQGPCSRNFEHPALVLSQPDELRFSLARRKEICFWMRKLLHIGDLYARISHKFTIVPIWIFVGRSWLVFF